MARDFSKKAGTRDSRYLLLGGCPPFTIGISRDFPDSFFALEMKDYQKMSKAELLEWIRRLRLQHATRSRAQRRQAASDLSDSAKRLRAILETAVEAIITIDERGTIESFNLAAEQIFGYKAKELIGQNVNILMPSPHREQHNNYLGNYLRTGHAKIIGLGREIVARRKNGQTFPIDLAVSEVRLAKQRLFTGFIRDISERKQAEKTLLHYAALVESSEDAIVGKTLDGHITSWNRGAEKIFGYTRAEMAGKPISMLIPADRKNEEPEILERIKRGESVDHYETRRRCKDGRLIDISVTISPIHDADGNIIGASKVARDITERKQLEKEILEISEREQRRIGQDLHDGLCQHLAGIELMSQVLEQKLAGRSKAAATRAGEIARNVRDAIGHTRLLARGLSPVTLESEGLMSALHELAMNTEKIFHVACRFECNPPVLVRDFQAATHLFRLAQEAVSNAIKHGKAKRILIRLKEERGRLELSIIDNGRGFPARTSKPKGMGLRIMQSRAGMIGGTLDIGRNASGGTSVTVATRNRVTRQK
ncbi:MAG TPA: PAS domain S-box protein [Candidatus Saccharimonadales bacterium]|nr:PAS domain S-box protein [Candidatus Saccharimonadales bacterium]